MEGARRMSSQGPSPLAERIARRRAQVVVIGAGYVGLPLSLALAGAGFPTTALERDAEKVRAIGAGRSYVRDVPEAVLAELVASGALRATTNAAAALSAADVVIVCVPTPLTKTR